MERFSSFINLTREELAVVMFIKNSTKGLTVSTSKMPPYGTFIHNTRYFVFHKNQVKVTSKPSGIAATTYE